MKNNFPAMPISFWFLFILVYCFSACKDHETSHQYIVDKSASTVEWKGYLKDGNGNNGTIQIEGELSSTAGGEITGGSFSMPLSSLVNINLPTDELKSQLIHHLQSTDFFDMATHPVVRFTIVSLTPDKVLPGIFQAKGDLTILGKALPVDFPVKVNFQQNRIEVSGETSIDRTQWGMTYASDENAADGMYIKPGIDIQFKLVATKN